MSMRIGPRHKYKYCELTTTRYYGQTQLDIEVYVYLVSSKNFSISIDYAKKSFYRAFNVMFGKVGCVALLHRRNLL